MNFNYQEKKGSLKVGSVFETDFYKYLIVKRKDGELSVVNLSLNILRSESFNDINDIKNEFVIVKIFDPEDVKVTLLTRN